MDHISDLKKGQSTEESAGILIAFITSDNRHVPIDCWYALIRFTATRIDAIFGYCHNKQLS